MRSRIRRLAAALALCTAASLALAGAAPAQDFFVDKDTGDDANASLNPACPQANPCQTLVTGSGIASGSGNGNTVRVDDSATPYTADNISLCGGVSIAADEFVDGAESSDGRPVVNASSASAFFVSSGCDAGTISGLRFETNDLTGINTALGPMTAITDNVFEDLGASGGDVGIVVGTGSPTISGNSFSGVLRGVQVNGGSPTISGNEFSGMRASAVGAGAGNLTLTGNFVHDPGLGADGFRIGNSGPTQALSATVTRNRIFGGGSGIVVSDTAGPVILDSDLVAGASTSAISIGDSGDDGDAATTIRNVTVVADSAASSDIITDAAAITLDSTIVGDIGIVSVNGGTCSISFSRGPVTGAGCDGFQTTADPQFVDVLGGDFHLLAGSPMIDAGDTASPPLGALDIDGQARALDGDGACPLIQRRDIGADEFSIAQPTCAPPPDGTPPSSPPSSPPPATHKKKCKKKKKAKKGAVVSKKCKKKRHKR